MNTPTYKKFDNQCDASSCKLLIDGLTRSYILDVRGDTNIWDLKRRIQDMEGVAVIDQRLRSLGTFLEDSASIDDCGLEDGDKVTVTVPLPGGMNSTRPLTSDEKSFLKKSLNSKRNNEKGYRPIQFHQSIETTFQGTHFVKKNNADSDVHSEAKLTLPILEESSLSLLHFAMLSLNADKVWTVVLGVLRSMAGVDPIFSKQTRRVFGNFYHNSTFCEFLLTLCETPGKGLILDCRRLRGDAFAMDDLFTILETNLVKEKLVQGDESDFEDYEDFDDEIMDFDFQNDVSLSMQGFLQLSEDPFLVQQWMHKLQHYSLDDQNHVMGLIAHNCQDESNREILLKDIENLIGCLSSIFERSTDAALIRNGAVILATLAPYIEFNANLMKVCVQALTTWAPKQIEPTNLAITESPETIVHLCRFLFTFADSGVAELVAGCPDKARHSIRNVLEMKGETRALALLSC